MMQKLLISLLCCATLLAGCSAHKLEIQQGNVVDEQALARLEIGMTKRQVAFLLGTPLLRDPFHHDRWDYLHSLEKPRQQPRIERLTLFFDGDRLARIEHGQ